MIDKVERIIAELGRAAGEYPPQNALSQIARQLAGTPEWSRSDLARSDLLSHRFELGRGLGAASGAAAPTSSESELVVVLLLKALLLSDTPQLRLRRLNGLLKAIDQVGRLPAMAELPIDGMIDDLLERCPTTSAPLSDPDRQDAPPAGTTAMSILFYEGPIARAYLETLRMLGLRPKRIINLVSRDDLVTKRPVGRWLPTPLRLPYAAHLQRQRIHFHGKRIARARPRWHAQLMRAVADAYGFPHATLHAAQRLLPLSSYASEVIEHSFTGWKDPLLAVLLASLAPETLLFTGGGIVPSSLLDLPHLRFLHVHPGFLPELRGADGLLWSMLTAGRPSASAFQMAPGIDTGDVMMSRWLPTPALPLSDRNIDSRTLYRAAFAFVDPWVRAAVLRQLLLAGVGHPSVAARPQSAGVGDTYYFMHDRLRARALELLFADEK